MSLQITSVSYSRLVSLGNYENEKLGASARVEEDQDPVAALEQLKEWVACRSVTAQQQYELRDRYEDLHRQISDYESRLASAKRKWEAASKLLEAHGINPDPWEELPF